MRYWALWAFIAPTWVAAQWVELGEGLYPGGPRTLVYDSALATLYAFGQFDFANDTIDVGGTAYWQNGAWYAMGTGVDGPGTAFPPIASCAYGNALAIGGFFPSMDNVPGTRGLAKWENGTWQHLGQVSQPGVPAGLSVLDGELHAFGLFDSIDGVWCNSWAINDGLAWRRADTTIEISNRTVTAVRYQGDLYLGGNYSLADGTHDIARKGAGGWEALGAGLGCDPWVNDMVEYQGLLYVAGEFCAIGAGADFLMAWDGMQWIDPFPNIEFTAQVRDLHIMGGKLVMAGRLQVVGEAIDHGLCYYDGTELCVFGGQDVLLIKIGGAGDSLFVSPVGATLNGDSVSAIAKWDMTNAPDTCFTVIQGLTRSGPEVGLVQIIPNPTTGDAVLLIPGWEKHGPLQLEVFDALGRLCFRDRLAPGSVQRMLSMAPFANGLYRIGVSTGHPVRSAFGNLLLQR